MADFRDCLKALPTYLNLKFYAIYLVAYNLTLHCPNRRFGIH